MAQVVNFPEGKKAISGLAGSGQWTELFISQATFTPILLGVGAAHLLYAERWYRFLAPVAGSRWASVISVLAIVALIELAPPEIAGLPRLALQICMTALLISCVYREDHVLRPLLTAPPIARLRQISYGMYLLHIPAIVLVQRLLQPPWLAR